MVRVNKPRTPLPQPESLDAAARRKLEEDNVAKCLAYARDIMGLRSS
jgi:hypothetical protein